ncbi:MAG TPA: hypothetical protein VGJ84_15360 [Polyangiaceae bacterium]|jgi:hypothetical protein
MRRISPEFVFFLFGLHGCSGGSGDGQLQCETSDRNGTYLITYVEHANGQCGPEPDQLATLGNSKLGVASDCIVVSEYWTEGNCTLARSIDCGDPATGERQITAVTHQRTSDGSRFEGILTKTIIGSTNACVSTYDVVAVRQ